MSGHFVIRGVVLRETLTKEADKILTLLTEERGKCAVIARGVRRKGCRYAACAQPLAYAEWTLYERGDWYYASDGTVLELFPGLRTDLEALALGSYFAELTEAVTVEEQSAGPLLRHLLNGLYTLAALEKPRELVKAAFEWKLLSLAGYEPLADACAWCGEENPAEPCMDLVQGVLHCRACGSHTLTRPLSPDALAALRHILYGEPRRLYAFRLSAGGLRRLALAAEGFVSAQLERSFRTLDFYRSLTGDGENNTN